LDPLLFQTVPLHNALVTLNTHAGWRVVTADWWRYRYAAVFAGCAVVAEYSEIRQFATAASFRRTNIKIGERGGDGFFNLLSSFCVLVLSSRYVNAVSEPYWTYAFWRRTRLRRVLTGGFGLRYAIKSFGCFGCSFKIKISFQICLSGNGIWQNACIRWAAAGLRSCRFLLLSMRH
jgi:hypothetical protein